MPNDPPVHDVSVRIEQEGTNKFRIQSDQLEQIGAQLRGRREFSIFQSIILPLIVSVATIVLSSAFQYVSWFNSVGVKDATDVADKAARTYETSAAAIGTRHYAMLVFLPSLRDLVQAKAEFEQSARARADLLNARAQATAVPGAMAQGKGARILSAHRPMQSEVLTPTARS
jgi:nitrogen fixation/metabolism regulation signal transduction histidine kinase